MPTERVLFFPSEPRRQSLAPDYEAEEQAASDAYVSYLLGLADTALRNNPSEAEEEATAALAA